MLSQEPCVGVNTYLNRLGRVVRYLRVSFERWAEWLSSPDYPNRAIRRIIGIQILEQRDEFDAPVPLLDSCGDVPVVEVQRRHN